MSHVVVEFMYMRKRNIIEGIYGGLNRSKKVSKAGK